MHSVISKTGIAAGWLWLVCAVALSGTDGRQRPSAEQAKASPAPRIVAEKALSAGRVCDARFLPTAPASSPKVLASVDVSGRFCNELLLIRVGEPPTVLQSIEAWGVDDLSKVLRDLDQDGELELIVPRMLSPYEGTAACIATKSTVFRCSAETCADVSARYDRFYAAELDELQRRIALAQARAPEEDEQLPCLTMESDRLRRVLGIDPRAGLELAERWMKSSDRIMRRRAVAVLADIDDPSARKNLALLASDRDPAVASLARRSMASSK